MEANKAYLFASANRGKFVEVHEVAERFGVQLVSALDVSRGPKGAPPDVEESASTYEGNARLKADAYWRWSGVPSFADDAGLEVDALNGGPGVFSARYAGEPCDPKRNIEKLLEALRGCENRRARFRSVICLVESGREPLYTTADLPGVITYSPRGQGGFGYDSVFTPDGRAETLAELKEHGVEVRTHRILALEKLFAMLRDGPA